MLIVGRWIVVISELDVIDLAALEAGASLVVRPSDLRPLQEVVRHGVVPASRGRGQLRGPWARDDPEEAIVEFTRLADERLAPGVGAGAAWAAVERVTDLLRRAAA